MACRPYRLIVEGELSDGMNPAFARMTLTRAGGNTTLTGPVRDQPELQGLLRRISDLGLTLLDVTALDEQGRPAASDKGRTDRQQTTSTVVSPAQPPTGR
jgi:hypothetical protein